MPSFLLEIGTEELPADFARKALPQLKILVSDDLGAKKLKHGKITCNSTPRRIVLEIADLASKSEDWHEDRKGPPASQGFVKGEASNAAIGFAKRYGIDVEDLEIRDTPKGEFLFITTIYKGLSASLLMQELIPKWISGLQGNRFMRWGNSELKFTRPIRWIVCKLDSIDIAVSIKDADPIIHSGHLSRGHRLYNQQISIPSATEYSKLLRKQGIIVDRKERQKFISNLISNKSTEISAISSCPLSLLEELTDLVESPSLIVGNFDESFLDLPPEVLCTVMQVHQRYIPLHKKGIVKEKVPLNSKNILFPSFLCISNGLEEASELIKKGNERVIKARFSDAQFFMKTDHSISSFDRNQKLKNVTFSEGLGSLYDRVTRIKWMAKELANILVLSQDTLDILLRSSDLCKNDLVSQMVSEFPELQGYMGSKYVIAEGESNDVALAILEHYSPRSSTDSLPESLPGAILAIAERIELILSIFSKGERPTGSSDPYALRRAGNGILQIIWEKELPIDLKQLLESSIIHWHKLFPAFKFSTNQLTYDISIFFQQRFSSLLEERGIESDLVQSISGKQVSVERLLKDPNEVNTRADLLMNLRKTGDLLKIQSVVTRAAKLAEKSTLDVNILSPSNVIDSNLFEKDSEFQMLRVLEELEPLVTNLEPGCYNKIADGLISSSNALSSFFDGQDSVLVMSDNKLLRENRLNLLSILRNQAFLLADFSVIN